MREESVLTIGSYSHPGIERDNNEDSLCVLAGSSAPVGAEALVAVADGVGGHAAGGAASQLAIDHLSRAVLGSSVSPSRCVSIMRNAVEEANEAIHAAAASEGRRGMATTLTAALIVGSQAVFAHVGDSRAYLLRSGMLRQLTNDHSWVAEQIAEGLLDPEEAACHPRRNVITRAVGLGKKVRVDVSTLTLRLGDSLLLCTDGIHGTLAHGEIASILVQETPQIACERMIDRANELGGPDNSTAVVVDFGGRSHNWTEQAA